MRRARFLSPWKDSLEKPVIYNLVTRVSRWGRTFNQYELCCKDGKPELTKKIDASIPNDSSVNGYSVWGQTRGGASIRASN